MGTQIVWTQWQSQSELAEVKAWLYETRSDDDEEGSSHKKRRGCDLVSAWKSRGGLPHAVESTWLLTEACLADKTPNIPMFSVKAGYVTAISRFVTGLLDAEQDSKYKVSMYAKAQQIGLPALFVNIRHEGAHGEMPLLDVLRPAAKRALSWLWDHYWNHQKGAIKNPENQMHRIHNRNLQGALQQGEWTQWNVLWPEKPIGAST